MATTDFKVASDNTVDRLTMVKSVLKSLAMERKNDRLGLIVFGSAAYLQMPFSEDHATWLTLLNETEIAMAGQSTVIGDAIGIAIKHFEESETKNRVLILLTDGNDAGSKVPPIDAAKIAASYGVKIYTIALGDPATIGERKLDSKTLKRIAELTGGNFYHAMDTSQLSQAYLNIAQLEPQTYDSISFRPKQSMHHIPLITLVIMNLCMVVYIRSRIKVKVPYDQ
jgi:Ca-activated chloride channel family protein